jgi:flagellar export protein FliJ
MKSLPTLIKLAQRKIDAIAIEIAQVQGRIDELEMKKTMLYARLEGEKKAVAVDAAYALTMTAYMGQVKLHAEELDTQIAAHEKELEGIRQRLNAAYQERSKLENLDEQYKLKARLEDNQREQAAMDEAAVLRRG